MTLDLEVLQSKQVGPYRTEIQFLPKQRIGHFDFSLFIKDKDEQLSRFPVVKGICSKGNRGRHIQSWFDFHYYDQFEFYGGNIIVLSRKDGLAKDLFRLIGTAVEAGGMIFVSYITDMIWNIKSDLHRFTRTCFDVSSLNIPPVATPLGHLLFASGCSNIKSRAFDVQGSSRIAGEKALDKKGQKQFLKKMEEQLREFLKRRPHPDFLRVEKVCRANAAIILNEIQGEI